MYPTKEEKAILALKSTEFTINLALNDIDHEEAFEDFIKRFTEKEIQMMGFMWISNKAADFLNRNLNKNHGN